MNPDVVIIGAGIVGASCARALSGAGLRVTVIESAAVGGGATAAGMGHLVVMDDSEAEFSLTHRSRDLWLELAPELPAACEFRKCGTVWVAADEEEFETVRRKHAWYGQRGVRTEILDTHALSKAEPNLRAGLAGGLLVSDDGVIYAPCAARWLLDRALEKGADLRHGAVAGVKSGLAILTDGEKIHCGTIVCANGCSAASLFPGLPIRPRKGHLAITDRYPGFVNHQLVELGYLKSAHGFATESVAFNAQPRPTGQVLLGSSRQFADTTEIDWPILRRMLIRALEYMPGLRPLSVIRTWTGFRAATPDGLPLIGPHEHMDRVLLATGHEGLGITTSLATGELIAAAVLGRRPAIPADPFLPSRCEVEHTHA